MLAISAKSELRPLMRLPVSWLFSNFVLCSANVTKTVRFLLLLALFFPGHSLVASRQELSFILFPGAQHPAFIFVRERIVLDNILRIFEMPLGVCDLMFSLFRHFVTSIGGDQSILRPQKARTARG